MKRMLLVAMLLGGVAATIPVYAGDQKEFPRFTIAQGHLDSDGFPTSGAKLCVLERKDVCYQMPSAGAPDSPSVVYQFGLNPRSERLPLSTAGSWVFFSSSFFAGGSGTLERLAVLRYDGDSIVNLMPFKGVTSNISDRAMWSVPAASQYPILVDADFVWSSGESHSGEHFYMVEAWCFDSRSDHYVRTFSYRTTRKYDDNDHVLSSERQELLRRLHSSDPNTVLSTPEVAPTSNTEAATPTSEIAPTTDRPAATPAADTVTRASEVAQTPGAAPAPNRNVLQKVDDTSTVPAHDAGIGAALMSLLGGSLVFLLLAIVAGLLLYMLPTLIARSRNHNNVVMIGFLNFFTGWTLLGWIGCLVWAVLNPPVQPGVRE